MSTEIKACQPWLKSEILLVKPQFILCLGATAAKTLLGNAFLITLNRGKWFDCEYANKISATYHPSAILRAPDKTQRHKMLKYFSNDIKKIAAFLMS